MWAKARFSFSITSFSSFCLFREFLVFKKKKKKAFCTITGADMLLTIILAINVRVTPWMTTLVNFLGFFLCFFFIFFLCKYHRFWDVMKIQRQLITHSIKGMYIWCVIFVWGTHHPRPTTHDPPTHDPRPTTPPPIGGELQELWNGQLAESPY